nr:immunoglobulin heavy chain junction region [Homo sapiens]
LFLLYSSRG